MGEWLLTDSGGQPAEWVTRGDGWMVHRELFEAHVDTLLNLVGASRESAPAWQLAAAEEKAVESYDDLIEQGDERAYSVAGLVKSDWQVGQGD